MKTLRIALCQINPTVGDIKGNTEKIIDYLKRAKALGSEIAVFPELAITGYPPEDLLLKPRFIEENLKALKKIITLSDSIAVIVGFIDRGDDIFNSAAIISDKKLMGIYHKMYLPNYGVFDENRYFQAGENNMLFNLSGTIFGISICEDIWYPEGPIRAQALKGAELLININASPYNIGKSSFRRQMLSTRASDNAVIVAYLNMVGGQDELVFDGRSLIINEKGEVIAEAKAFEEQLLVADLDIESVFIRRLHDPRRRKEALLLKEDIETIEIPIKKAKKVRLPKKEPVLEFSEEEEIYKALLLGVSDYARKNGFKGVLVGLSGGVDSALVAAIATDALGPQRVTAVFMPSRYTSIQSRKDAYEVAKNLGIRCIEVPIDKIFQEYLDTLKDEFLGLPPDVTEENLQARIRGNILMALSNKFGLLVLTTGNKSEMSVGYATLYGDMAGGFAVIKDVPKTLVYRLSKWRNSKGAVIPESVIKKEPTAELRAGQKDTDTLPPYSMLDPILKAYVEEDRSIEEILSMGFDPKIVRKVSSMVDRSEYKRRQSPPGIKITPRAFGRDRRFPITNLYEDR